MDTPERPPQLTEATLAGHFEHPDMPDVDLLIRTAGEQRLSNFLLWHAAYAELVFLDVLWPDFRAEHYRQAIQSYHQRNRRFGAAPQLANHAP
ncbi:undecaprenyl diphosphate synthase family protein [Nocardia wallacei]|uniref:undecaprenyl diphosphate synthase family protein n=1 Tax=Nocardia wallacei TaxID=480035 RepID=UPI001E56E0F0|nr:undecaprenyl diphosphate synthase family protein [Nocardia wallacei]